MGPLMIDKVKRLYIVHGKKKNLYHFSGKGSGCYMLCYILIYCLRYPNAFQFLTFLKAFAMYNVHVEALLRDISKVSHN